MFFAFNRRHSDFGVFFTAPPEQQIIAKFLDAVVENPKDAWSFVSAVYSPRLDLDELREILGTDAKIMAGNAVYFESPKNCITRSIYVENSAKNTLLHLRMVKNGGAWKIYGVEPESL
ncbi:MAG: hypothetical protein FWF77_00245 [Defluviitaleaceae bacterium]|nr:hypothetical protein [Defluviitaleaceae bacterium]